MNSDDLRSALAQEAAREPAPAPDLRSRVAAEVRRRRVLATLAAAPLVAAAVLAVVLVAGRAPGEAELDAAAPPRPGSVPGTLAPTRSTTSVRAPVTSAPAAPTPTPSTTAAPDGTNPGGGPAPADGECGTVTITGLPRAADPAARREAFKSAYLCVAAAVNAGRAAHLVVVVEGSAGGALTVDLKVRDGVVTVTPTGAATFSLPPGLVKLLPPDQGAPAGPVDCGTVTVSPETAKQRSLPPDLLCLLGAVRSGGSFTVVMQDRTGGAVTARVTIAAGTSVTVALDGTASIPLPPGVTLPEDLLDRLPAMGAAGALGGLESGAGPGAGKGTWPGRGQAAGDGSAAPSTPSPTAGAEPAGN